MTLTSIRGQENQGGQNNPYVDNRIVHFGFSLGMNLMAFGVDDSNLAIDREGNVYDPGAPDRPDDAEVYHARVTNLMPGFSVGFITDLRLCKYLNLRFTPTLHFASRSIKYVAESGRPVTGSPGNGDLAETLSLPIDIPLYLKYSAKREKNYCPYVIAGGGYSYNVSRDKEKPMMLKGGDWFVGVGFGFDIYLPWFKLCPEIKYQLGFKNQLMGIEERKDLEEADMFYTLAISRLTNHTVTISFNFE